MEQELAEPQINWDGNEPSRLKVYCSCYTASSKYCRHYCFR